MKMERDILDIIVDKEFHDLTTLEKQELKEFCSTKAEFEELKIARESWDRYFLLDS